MEADLIFYIDQKHVGECSVNLPRTLDGYRGYLIPFYSTHWISPYSGRVWASVEILGQEWLPCMVPAPGEPSTWSRRAGHLMLDWVLGPVYDKPEVIQHFPPQFLALELEAEYLTWKMELKHGLNG